MNSDAAATRNLWFYNSRSKEWNAATLSLFGSETHDTENLSLFFSLAANYTCALSEAMNNTAQFLVLISYR